MVAFKKDRISEDKQRVSLLIDKDTYARVKEIAAERGISANEFMTTSISNALDVTATPAAVKAQLDELERRIERELTKIKLQLLTFY